MMDVERTIEFLLHETAKHDEQIAQLVGAIETMANRQDFVMANLVTRQNRLDDALRKLTDTQTEQAALTQAQFRRTDARIDQLSERMDNLVISIGLLIARLPLQ